MYPMRWAIRASKNGKLGSFHRCAVKVPEPIWSIEATIIWQWMQPQAGGVLRFRAAMLRKCESLERRLYRAS